MVRVKLRFLARTQNFMNTKIQNQKGGNGGKNEPKTHGILLLKYVMFFLG